MQNLYVKTESFFFVLMTCSIEYLDVNLAIILTTNFALLSKSPSQTCIIGSANSFSNF